MGPGIDPHLYKATEGDVHILSNSTQIIYNGLHLESKMGEIFEKMSHSKRVLAAAESIPKSKLIYDEFSNQYDPHIWFSIPLWLHALDSVTTELIGLNPDQQQDISARSKKYKMSLLVLDQYVRQRISQVPKDRRVLITAHDAFAYFGKEYGFTVKGLQGISTESEAGARDVQDLVNYIVDNKIPAIFIETSIPERNIKAVQEAARAKGWDVAIGGHLYSDALGPKGSKADTYIGMVKHNVDTIVNALSK
jgi:manganese/zinc/iron transport system substrate-binding protein